MHANSSCSSVSRFEPIWQMIAVRRSQWSSPRLQREQLRPHLVGILRAADRQPRGWPGRRPGPTTRRSRSAPRTAAAPRASETPRSRGAPTIIQRGIALLAEARVVPQLAAPSRATPRSSARRCAASTARTGAAQRRHAQPQVRHADFMYACIGAARTGSACCASACAHRASTSAQRGCSCSSGRVRVAHPAHARCETASRSNRRKGHLDEDRQQRHQQRPTNKPRVLLPREAVDDVATQARRRPPARPASPSPRSPPPRCECRR